MELEYLIQEPENTENAPLIILLHGYGSNEKDLFSFAPELSSNYRIISLRAPYNLGMGDAYAWYAINFDADQNKFSDLDQAKSSLNLLETLIGDFQKKYGNTAENTALIGFSQGCILSLALGLNHPELVQNVVGLSGYLMEELLPEDKSKTSTLNIYNSHGTMDAVIPFSWAAKTEEKLAPLGLDYTFESYPVGHGVHPRNFYSFKNWLEEKLG